MDSLKGKRLLLQGASRGNLGLIKTAKKEGVYVIMTGLGGDFPCNPYADKFCYADISDPDAVLKVAIDEKVDGAIICCSDTGLRGVGRCNDVLGLCGISEESAKMSSNKLLMKERLVSEGVRTARFCRVKDQKDLLNAADFLSFPLIVKAIDLQGSRGINIVRSQEGLLQAFKETMAVTKKEFCIIEEFIEGKEFGVQSFVFNHKILFILPHGDETIVCNTAVPVGHYMPYEVDKNLYDDIRIQVTKAIYALGLNNCAVNVDLIEKDGKAFIIELTGRVGANCLPELTSNYFGINYYEMILRTALGEDPIPVFEKKSNPCYTLARMVRSDKSGICKSVSVPAFHNVDINMFIHQGSEIRAFTNSNDAIGEIITKGSCFEECEVSIIKATYSIKIEYE